MDAIATQYGTHEERVSTYLLLVFVKNTFFIRFRVLAERAQRLREPTVLLQRHAGFGCRALGHNCCKSSGGVSHGLATS